MLTGMLKTNLQNIHYDFQRFGTSPSIPVCARNEIITSEDR